MIKLLSVLLVPVIAFGIAKDVKASAKIEHGNVESKASSVILLPCNGIQNYDTYEEKHDKTERNDGISTLEEPIKSGRGFNREKKPLARISIVVDREEAIKTSGEEEFFKQSEDIFAFLNEKFEQMYEIREKIDEYERETSRLWSEYYALKDVYDRALGKYSEKWAEDNGISFLPKTPMRR